MTEAELDDNNQVLDQTAAAVVRQLADARFFPHETADYPAAAFYDLHQRVREGFTVPTTTMTTIACRVLFGLSAARRPRTIVGLGTFVGYAVVWLFGPALGDARLFRAERMVGCDINRAATEQARRNFATLPDGDSVELVTLDAAACLERLQEPIELLYIDVDSEQDGKASYAGLLERALPKLAPGALVVAHDVTHPWFQEDMVPYRAMVQDKRRFHSTATLKVDPCGLEVTLVRA